MHNPGNESVPIALPDPLLAQLWQLTRVDFSEVRIHACALPASLGLRALASGSHLLFAPGFYNPGTRAGRQLIFHEIMHCLQQWSGKLRGRSGLVSGPSLEREANAFASSNQQWVRPSTVTRRLPSFLPEPFLCQPAIGFEFQTGWRVSKRATVHHRFKRREQRDSRLPNTQTVLCGGRNHAFGWSMENDLDEIEFVVEPPIEESAVGMTELTRVFGSLSSFLANLSAHGNLPELTPRTHPQFFNPGTDNAIVIKPQGPILAQPQITMGVRLGRLHYFFDEMNRMRQANEGLFEREGTNSDYFSTIAGRLGGIAANIPAVNGQPPSNKLRGLVSLISQYIIRGQGGGARPYLKDTGFVMPRTDFSSIFRALSAAEQQWFQANLDQWVDYCLTAAGVPNTTTERLINQLIGPRRIQVTLTRGDWLRSIATDNVDLLSDSTGLGLGTHLGHLRDRFDPVGRVRQDQSRHRGVILEFRQMQRNIPYQDWYRMATDVLTYLIALNDSHAIDTRPQFQRTLAP